MAVLPPRSPRATSPLPSEAAVARALPMAGTMAASPPPRSAPMHLTARLTALILTCLLVLAGCANSGPAAHALDESPYSWSGDIRWVHFGGPLNLFELGRAAGGGKGCPDVDS